MTDSLPVKIDVTVKADVTAPINNVVDTGLSPVKWLGSVLGEIGNETFGLITDKIKQKRIENILKFKRRMFERYPDVKLEETEVLNLKNAEYVMKEVSYEENNEKIDMWCDLIANLSKENYEDVKIDIALQIIKDMNQEKYAILLFFYMKKLLDIRNDSFLEWYFSRDVQSTRKQISQKEARVIFDADTKIPSVSIRDKSYLISDIDAFYAEQISNLDEAYIEMIYNFLLDEKLIRLGLPHLRKNMRTISRHWRQGNEFSGSSVEEVIQYLNENADNTEKNIEIIWKYIEHATVGIEQSMEQRFKNLVHITWRGKVFMEMVQKK